MSYGGPAWYAASAASTPPGRSPLEGPAASQDACADDTAGGWAMELPAAIAANRLELDCQPIMPAGGGDAVAYELLVRLRRGRTERCMPGAFLPFAERSGLSRALDRWVIRHALEWLAGQHGSGGVTVLGPQARLTINLSAPSLVDAGLLQFMDAAVVDTGADVGRLCIEVTESTAIPDLHAAAGLLGALRERGMYVALDDFGTGHSSLDYLHALPVDWLKIDGVFVAGMLQRGVDLAIVRSIIDLGHSLDMTVVAEFVENERQVHVLRDLGVDCMQGFAFGRPFPLRSLD